MKKTKIIYFIFILNFALAICQFYLSSRRATDGTTLADLYQQISSLQLENSNLAQQVYSHASLANISLQVANLTTLPTSFFAPPSVAQVR